MIRKHFLAGTIGLALALAPLSAEAQSTGPGSNADTFRNLELFGTVVERILNDYVEPVEEDKLIESAINGMLTSLDPHSSFLNKDDFSDMQVRTKGEFGGLGIEVTMEAGLVKVVSPIDDTPAFRAGIKAGDFITHIDGEQVMGMTLNDAVDRMRGPVNTDIKITIRRSGRDPFDVTITRARIRVQSVRFRTEGDIGYVRITQFNEQTDVGLQKAFAAFDKDLGGDLKGVVLDLRNNPGGLLDQAIAVSDAFLQSGEVVSTRSRDPQDIERYHAREGDIANGLPVVVLVNDGSASASEIVAGALQDHHRAIIMGTKTFGKGSVQTIIPLPGRVAMRMTTSRYYTPSGRSIQAVGIQPDIIVPQATVTPLNNGHRRSEADLRGALSNDAPPDGAAPGDGQDSGGQDSGGQNGGAQNGDAAPADGQDGQAATGADAEDYQLKRALDLLRGLALYSGAGAPASQ